MGPNCLMEGGDGLLFIKKVAVKLNKKGPSNTIKASEVFAC